MESVKINRSPKRVVPERQVQVKVHVESLSRPGEVEKGIGGWKVERPEGRTVHVVKPLGSKYFKDFVTKSAMTKASAALARLHQSRLG